MGSVTPETNENSTKVGTQEENIAILPHFNLVFAAGCRAKLQAFSFV